MKNNFGGEMNKTHQTVKEQQQQAKVLNDDAFEIDDFELPAEHQ